LAEQDNTRYWDWVYDADAGDWRQPYPQIYTSPELPGEYIVRASDGKLYALPDAPGAWLYRRELTSSYSSLVRVEAEEARRLVHTVAGGYTWLWPLSHPYIVTD
jgi:hypothetical protein